MAVPTHFRFTARGVFDGSPEQWSFGFHMTRVNVGGADAETTDIDQSGVTNAFAAFLGAGEQVFDTRVKMTDWRAYVIGTDNRMEGNPLVVDVTGNNIAGTGTPRYPTQIACAVTLVADNRGAARFGRFYIPGITKTMAADSRMSIADTTAIAVKATDFLKAVSDSIDLEGVASSAAGCNVSSRGAPEGTLQEIDHVEVGRAYDTLRSRRSQLLEERIVGAQIDW